ncbi:hypothetical protein [Amycolatopsis regifaucium]|uniref:Uncharacterized protein n=1 Tax=Amycolatopsis regifaucium TaxID=546365 RepID=A0A154MDK4_9PSEU|nr:hypothetical protein [Amycolatopsis regifaucium]KZB82247.1 hypothetical protein AVL48_09985 [Amycolatopsis regifaucium]OKA05681.1 hypothetical protein ATP06_0220995 [Amycolatopsis regifaucium]SFG87468.1 hypothetical protein SAMN04489731_101781 [Amycolatopsis regifaucium]
MIRYRSALAVACGVALAVPAAAYAQDDVQPSPSPTTTASPKADPYPFLGLSPRQAMAGEDILVSVGCPVGELGEVKSMVFDHIGKFEVTNPDPVIHGAVAQLSDKARPGFYAITATCKTTTMTANLQIVAKPASSNKPPKPTLGPGPAPEKPGPAVKPASGRQVSKIPVGAPQTGGGGTTH